MRQLVEKTLEGQDDIAIGFTDLEKAADIIPRETTLTILR